MRLLVSIFENECVEVDREGNVVTSEEFTECLTLTSIGDPLALLFNKLSLNTSLDSLPNSYWISEPSHPLRMDTMASLPYAPKPKAKALVISCPCGLARLLADARKDRPPASRGGVGRGSIAASCLTQIQAYEILIKRLQDYQLY